MSELLITPSDLDPYLEAVPTVQHILEQYVTRNLKLKPERVSGRVKDLEDIHEKINRKKYDIIDKEDIFNKMCDIAGTRVICDYLSEVKEVARFISSSDKFKVETVCDYITTPDCTGYRSYHVDVTVDTDNFAKVKCEIQVRTVTQHSWAEKSHTLVYKKDKFEIPKTACNLLKTLSNHLHTADEYAEGIRDLIKGGETE